MVLRSRKSLRWLSAIFTNAASKKPREGLVPDHLIWILLSSVTSGPQYAETYGSSVCHLRHTLSMEPGIHSVVQLKNTSPACTLSGSKAMTAKRSPASLLAHVDGSENLKTTVKKLRTLLEDGEIARDAEGKRILHWRLQTYFCVQTFRPTRQEAVEGSCIVAVAIDPAEGQDEDVDAWYRKEHLSQLSTSPLFLRCRRYIPVPASWGVGLGDNEGVAKYLAVHDYTSVQDLFDHSISKGPLVEETAWTRRVMDGAKGVERSIWSVVP